MLWQMKNPDEDLAPRDKSAMQRLLDQSRIDERSLTELLEVYRNYLWTIATEELEPALAAKISPKDVIQDVIFKAHIGFGTFHSHTVDELTAWLRTLLKNHLSDLRRRYTDTQMRQLKREVSIQDLDSHNFLEQLATDVSQNPAEMLAKLDDKFLIEKAVSQLEPHHQQVVRWRLEGLDTAEIGGRLGMSSHQVRALWQRTLNKLRQLLLPELENSETP